MLGSKPCFTPLSETQSEDLNLCLSFSYVHMLLPFCPFVILLLYPNFFSSIKVKRKIFFFLVFYSMNGLHMNVFIKVK